MACTLASRHSRPAKLAGMSAYKMVNLMELDDSVGDRAPQIEGRFARSHLESRDLGVSHWRYDPGFRSPVGHRHGEQEEAYVVVSGSGRIVVDGEVLELREWDVVRVAPEDVRASESPPAAPPSTAVRRPRPAEPDR